MAFPYSGATGPLNLIVDIREHATGQICHVHPGIYVVPYKE